MVAALTLVRSVVFPKWQMFMETVCRYDCVEFSGIPNKSLSMLVVLQTIQGLVEVA